MRINAGNYLVQVYAADDIASLLEIPVSSILMHIPNWNCIFDPIDLVDFSMLCGNDYARNLTSWEGILMLIAAFPPPPPSNKFIPDRIRILNWPRFIRYSDYF